MPMNKEVVDQFLKSDKNKDQIRSRNLRCEFGKTILESPLLLTSTRNAKIETAVQRIDTDSSKLYFLSEDSPFTASTVMKRSLCKRLKILPIAIDERSEYSGLFIGFEST